MCFTSSVGISHQLWTDSLGFKVNQRPVRVARQLARPQDYSGGFQPQLLLDRIQGAKVNLASYQCYQRCSALICKPGQKLGVPPHQCK